MLFPELKLGLVQFTMDIGRRQLPLLFSCVDWTQRAAIPPRSSERDILAGFRESNLIHPITLNRPPEGMPTGEFCLRQNIEKPGN